MMDTIQFTQALIAAHKLTESSKVRKRSLKESEDFDDSTYLEAQEEQEAEASGKIDDIADETAPEEEESISDSVYYCTVCNKHFLATEDTPASDIVCPVCGAADKLIDMGTAEQALDNATNAETCDELEVEDITEESVKCEEAKVKRVHDKKAPARRKGFDLVDEASLNEAVALMLKRSNLNENYKCKSATAKGTSCKFMFESAKGSKLAITFNKFNPNSPSQICEGVMEARGIRQAKVKGKFVIEKNAQTLSKLGYAIKESTGLSYKGILG